MISSVLDSGDSNHCNKSKETKKDGVISLIDANFVGIVILMQHWVSNISDKELLFLITKKCWLIIEDHRSSKRQRIFLNKIIKKRKIMNIFKL